MRRRVLYLVMFTTVLTLLVGCGGGSGGSSDGGSGTLSVSVTDAKPVIPGDPTELWIAFEEIRAHKSGGGWVTLPLPQTPLWINLLAFQEGATTHLVPPVRLDSGQYTQLRFEVSRAYMVIDGKPAVEIGLDVPSGFLRIDKNFTFDVPSGEAVDLTVDFDLSQSIVVTGSSDYKLKPVLHLVETQRAATIHGEIEADAFGDPAEEAVVTVIWDKNGNGSVDPYPNDEEYTKVIVKKANPSQPTEFSIFWLVPDEDYIVRIDVGEDDAVEHEEEVPSSELQPGEVFELNGGAAIE